jgi:hypothetical protein
MQDEIVFRLRTEANDTSSGTHGTTDTAGGLGSSISTLNESIKSLSNNLKSFTLKFNSIKENLSKGTEPSYAQTTSRMRAEAYKTRSDFLNDPQGKQISQQRAEANLLRIETEKQRQDLKNDILKRASEYKLSGDTKFAKKLESDVSESLSGGINKGVNQSKLAQVFTAIGGAGLILSTANKLFSSQSTAGLAMMQNPYTNGYDYGGQVSGVMQANTQKENAYVGLGAAGIGAIIGSVVPVIGTAVGAIAGSLVGGAYGSYASSQTNLKSMAASSLVNNTMNAQALSATNQAAQGIYTKGMYNRRITDVEQPLVLAMSKAAGVYNRNFKEIDKLTDYVRAGNMSIQQGAGLTGAVSFLTQGMNQKQQGNFIDKMKQSFSAYGVVDPASTAVSAMMFKQAGMGASDAAELAARATGLNPGAQGALSNYYSQPITSRGMQNFISKSIYGVNLPNLVTGKGDARAEAYRKNALNFEKTGNLGSLDPRAMGFEQLYNLTNEQTVGKQIESRAITSTPDQKRIQDLTNQTIAKNAEGMTLEKAIGTLNGEIDSTSKGFSQLGDTTKQLTNAFNGLMSKLGMGAGTGQINAPIKAQAAKPMSGNTAVTYNPISGHAIPQKQMDFVREMIQNNPKYFKHAGL